jgi:hypothetical protein
MMSWKVGFTAYGRLFVESRILTWLSGVSAPGITRALPKATRFPRLGGRESLFILPHREML